MYAGVLSCESDNRYSNVQLIRETPLIYECTHTRIHTHVYIVDTYSWHCSGDTSQTESRTYISTTTTTTTGSISHCDRGAYRCVLYLY